MHNVTSIQLKRDGAAVQRHLERLFGLGWLDLSKVKQRRFTVALDCVRGAGATVMPNTVNPRATAPRAHTPRFLPRDIGARGRYNDRPTATITLSTVSANGMLCHNPKPSILD